MCVWLLRGGGGVRAQRKEPTAGERAECSYRPVSTCLSHSPFVSLAPLARSSPLSMSWRRLPGCLPNLPIRLVPLSEPAQKAYEATGFVKQLVFKTVPSVGKV